MFCRLLSTPYYHSHYSKMFLKKAFVATTLILLGCSSRVNSTKDYDKLMASPFMTAVMVRDQFEDEDFVFDYNPLIDLE